MRFDIAKRILTSTSLFLFTLLHINAQTSHIQVEKNLIYSQGKTPEKIDNYNYTSFYTAGKDSYTLKNAQLSHSSENIIDFKVNPAGYSYAVLAGNGKKFSLTIYDSNVLNKELAKMTDLLSPGAITYSSDSRKIYLADNSSIKQLSSKDLSLETSFPISGKPSKIVVDNNGMFLCCVYPTFVEIFNPEDGILRKSIPSSSIADVAFSPESDRFFILSDIGMLEAYRTFDFNLENTFTDLGISRCVSIHPDGKYAALAGENNRIQFLNLTDGNDRPYLTDPTGPKNYVRFVKDTNRDVFITYDADKSIVYKKLGGFIANFSKLVREGVNDRMREWSKMRPMETEEEYRERMSAENVEKQRKLFANEIATSLAGDLINRGTVTLGKYNPDSGILAINIGDLPTVYLKVPKEDMSSFGDGSNLSFSNPVFTITPQDTFEVIYVDVFNPTNNKNYTFDNLDGQNLEFLATDDSFVSLDLLLKSNREDVMLKGLKDKIVSDAMAKNLISDHTNIKVDTRIVPSIDANGNRINNYQIGFNYTVSAGYSEKEDYPAGEFSIQQSNAAQSMLKIVKQAFENELAQYIVPGKKLIIEITGSADGTPVNRIIPYNGNYGVFENEPVRVNGELSTIFTNTQGGIRNNEELAFMRAQGVKHELENNIISIDSMYTDYKYNIEVSKNRGSQYRRISLILTFIDAL